MNKYQEPNIDAINLQERQLYLQSSSINPLTGQQLRNDPGYQQSGPNYNLDKKVALQSSTINPLTGAPIIRPNQGYLQQQYQPQQSQGINNDPNFQKNLNAFYGADDNSISVLERKKQQKQQQYNSSPYGQQQNNQSPYNQQPPSRPPQGYDQGNQGAYQNSYAQNDPYQRSQVQQPNQQDPQFQNNLNKFFAADDPNPTPVPKRGRQVVDQQRLETDPVFQKNVAKFFAADDNSTPAFYNKKPYDQQQQLNNFENQKMQRLENDPRFQKNLQQFWGIDDQSKQQGIQGTIQQTGNRQSKVLAVCDSSSIAKHILASFFRTRGIDDYDVFTCPGGVFGFNQAVWQECLKSYIDFMLKNFNVRDIYLVSSLDPNTNAKFYSNLNDRKSHHVAMDDLRQLLTARLSVQLKITGIVIDQRGASEKVF